MTPGAVRVLGHLYVLLGMREELRADGGTAAQRFANRDAISRARAELERAKTGDLTDATAIRKLVGWGQIRADQ